MCVCGIVIKTFAMSVQIILQGPPHEFFTEPYLIEPFFKCWQGVILECDEDNCDDSTAIVPLSQALKSMQDQKKNDEFAMGVAVLLAQSNFETLHFQRF